jgi:hypothetical protein
MGGKHAADGVAERHQLGAVAPVPALGPCTATSAVAVTAAAAVVVAVGATAS